MFTGIFSKCKINNFPPYILLAHCGNMSTRFIWRSHHIYYTQTHTIHIRRELSHISPKALSSQKPDFEPYIYSISFESGDTVSATKLNARCQNYIYTYKEKKRNYMNMCHQMVVWHYIIYLQSQQNVCICIPTNQYAMARNIICLSMYTTFSISFWWI